MTGILRGHILRRKVSCERVQAFQFMCPRVFLSLVGNSQQDCLLQYRPALIIFSFLHLPAYDEIIKAVMFSREMVQYTKGMTSGTTEFIQYPQGL